MAPFLPRYQSTQHTSSALEDQRRREARITEANRTREARDIEERRTREARDIEERRVQEAALQQYFEQMGQLLRQGLRRSYTKEIGQPLRLGLLKPDERDEERIYEEQQLRSLAGVQTDRILEGLAPRRKWLLLSFLGGSGLIDREAPIVDLRGADLRRIILCEYLTIDKVAAREYLDNDADPSTYLSKDNLSAVLRSPDDNLDAFVNILLDTRLSASLASTSFQGAHLMGAYLRSVGLSGADLSEAYLLDADLIDVDLSNAYLRGSHLTDAVLLAATLNMANLSRVDAYGAVFVKAVLAEADLSQAVLAEADLRRADLRRTNLSGANLSGADLSGADLSEAVGITTEELEQQALSLEGVIMPDGSKHP
jgi:uncharacterized protein YjbI with pentapeptide repeats